MTGRHCRRALLFAPVWFVIALMLAPASAEIAGCSGLGKPFAIAEAVGASDAITIRLAGGQEVRLAGIDAPMDFSAASEHSRRAMAALNDLVAGRRVALHGVAEATDRYGRLIAQVTLTGTNTAWVQSELVRAGMARVAPAAGLPDCVTALIGREKIARQLRAGLWGDGALSVKEASATKTLLAGLGGFAVIEGTVLRVGEAGGRLFLDFGRRYSRDFSIIVPRDAQAGFAKAGLDLRGLSGKRVRARGVLFEQGGPAMELRSPAALEVIRADGA